MAIPAILAKLTAHRIIADQCHFSVFKWPCLASAHLPGSWTSPENRPSFGAYHELLRADRHC
jgi:hypothetical protein